jgi:hypothetical protein
MQKEAADKLDHLFARLKQRDWPRVRLQTPGKLPNDPRFARLCARLGLVELWTATGRWPDCAGEVPYDFRAECAKARDIPKEEFAPPAK